MNQTMSSSPNCTKTIKFLYSYGGRIIPRPTDGELRYVGGYTRVLSVDRFVTFAELMVKFGESCGSSMNLKCKLPTEDLDLLVTIKSDADLKNLIEEYERVSPEAKIRAVLCPIINSAKKISPPSSPMSCFDFPSASRNKCVKAPAVGYCYSAPAYKCFSPAIGYPIGTGSHRCHGGRSTRNCYSVAQQNRTR